MIRTDDPESSRSTHSADRHLRLTLEANGQALTILQIQVIEEPVVHVDQVAGPFVYQVFWRGQVIWIGTLPDPFVQRSFPRPNEHAHYFTPLGTAMVVVRVPLPDNQLPADLQVRCVRAAIVLPLQMDLLTVQLRALDQSGFQSLGIIDLPALMQHPDWERITRESGITAPN